MSDLIQKIWEVKKGIPALRKESEGFKFKYVNLEDIEKVLDPLVEEAGLGYRHRTYIVGDLVTNVVETVVYLKDDPSKFEVTTIAIPSGVALAGQNSFQSIGSAITYFRRYNLVCLFDILGTDSDLDSIGAQVQTRQEPVVVDYIDKVKSLISLGRKRANLERYFNEYSEKMTDDEKATILEIIKTVEV
jgi:hypothetical protein